MSVQGQEFISRLKNAGAGLPTPHTTGVTRINPEPGEPGYESYAPPPEPDAFTQVLDMNGHPIRTQADDLPPVGRELSGDKPGRATWITFAASPGHVILTVVDSGRVPRVSATISRRVAVDILPVLEALGDVLDLTNGGLHVETRPDSKRADRADRGDAPEPPTERLAGPEGSPAGGDPSQGRPTRRSRGVSKPSS